MRDVLRTLAGERGSAAIEFAMIAPVLALLVVATVELGFMMRARIVAQEAASAGALYATSHTYDAAAIAAIKAAAQNSTNEMAITAADPTLSYGCPATSGVTPANAGAICSDGKSARRYVTVSASVQRVSILGSNLDLPTTVTANSTVRLP